MGKTRRMEGEVLIKSIAQAIPTNVMIDVPMRKLHWLRWDKIWPCLRLTVVLVSTSSNISTLPCLLNNGWGYWNLRIQRSSLWLAKRGSRPSYSRSSVYSSKWGTEKGFYRVGTCENINIWEDCWVPSVGGFKIFSSQQLRNRFTTVSTALWLEAEQILSIPLSCRVLLDEHSYFHWSRQPNSAV